MNKKTAKKKKQKNKKKAKKAKLELLKELNFPIKETKN